MALKPDRKITDGTNIAFFCNNVTERGMMARVLTEGSGAAMDQGAAVVVSTGATTSGVYTVGMIINDVVNKDLTQTHLNAHKDEVQVGGKVTLLRQGEVVTNVIDTGSTPAAGAPAYFYGNGQTFGTYTNAYVLADRTRALLLDANCDTTLRCGTWLSKKDEDGYAKVDINIR